MRRSADITLTENYAMWPAAAVSGFYFSHPDAQYFAVGKIDRDQAEDYARRKAVAISRRPSAGSRRRWLTTRSARFPL